MARNCPLLKSRGNGFDMKKFESRSEAETVNIAREFAKSLKPGDIVALRGELGAGKTAFVKGVADFFGVDGAVSSPTFTVVNEYSGRETIYHFDAYRLEGVDIDNLDWLDDYLFGDGICIIEWSENIESVLPEGCVSVAIEKNPSLGEDYREVTIC